MYGQIGQTSGKGYDVADALKDAKAQVAAEQKGRDRDRESERDKRQPG